MAAFAYGAPSGGLRSSRRLPLSAKAAALLVSDRKMSWPPDGALRRVTERGIRWPVLLCAVVATIAGSVAFVRSPFGQTPVVRHATATARVETKRVASKAADRAIDAAVALAVDLASRSRR